MYDIGYYHHSIKNIRLIQECIAEHRVCTSNYDLSDHDPIPMMLTQKELDQSDCPNTYQDLMDLNSLRSVLSRRDHLAWRDRCRYESRRTANRLLSPEDTYYRIIRN